MVIERIKYLLQQDPSLRRLAELSLSQAAQANPHFATNPVRTIDDWLTYLRRFLRLMPWQTMDIGEDASFFRRIDQNIGYFYFLLDQPLDDLRDKGYTYPSLQYEPRIALWLKEYNTAWGNYLNSRESWTNRCYRMACSDPRFELSGNKYESPDRWHCWNDFFARRLSSEGLSSLTSKKHREDPESFTTIAEGVRHPWLPIYGNTIDVKTAKIQNITDLLGNSTYKQRFENGTFMHITLDVYNYHRFHSPCDGTIADIQHIDGIHTSGGHIIWDDAEHRYRYEQPDNIGFQMIEKRVAIVINSGTKNKEQGARNKDRFAERTRTASQKEQGPLIAVIPVGVAQVGSIILNEEIKTGATLKQGQELGCFLCGGSDVIVMKEKDK